ncbi:MAG: amidohydrolase family protein [Clostridiales Family XIII bacterium]|nr:amidohydrolase family protein [Clostridia bacterium]MDE8735137.1 amidohydrolase family protein [Eubacteriales bacterium DFI.9.88]MDY3011785.1 amidohydrolase family protein [Clostridiales Family XIII bacterium]
MKIDKVLFNGKIYTSVQETPWAEALAISGRKIAFAGSNEEARAVADADTEMIDLEGKTILPGFLDGHTHPTTVAKTFYRVRMPLTHDKDELLANIQKYAKQYPKEERPFLFCENYFAETFGPKGPRKEELDQIVSDRPARIQDFTDHACWFNSMALEMLKDENGIPHSKSPVGEAQFVKDENGEYTGWCLEGGPEGDLGIYDAIGWYPPDTPDEEMIKPLLDFFKANGVMCMLDGFTEGGEAMKLFSELDQAGKLGMYYEGASHAGTIHDLEEAIKNVRQWQAKYGTERVHINTVKMFVDGTNELGDCLALEPFKNDPEGKNCGHANLYKADLVKAMVRLNEEAIDLHLHIICDGAFRNVVDALEEARKICGHGWKIRVTGAHCELTHPHDRERAAELGLYIDWSTHWSGGYFGEAAQEFHGIDRWNTMYDFREFTAAGGNLGFSSDVFSYQEAVRANPFFGIQAAMTRVDPVFPLDPKKYPGSVRPPEGAKYTLEELIKGYTINNAARLRLDDKMGSLEPGKLANFMVLNRDIFTTTAEQMSAVTAECTYFEGEKRCITSSLSVSRE